MQPTVFLRFLAPFLPLGLVLAVNHAHVADHLRREQNREVCENVESGLVRRADTGVGVGAGVNADVTVRSALCY
jgi:hypothetical protein